MSHSGFPRSRRDDEFDASIVVEPTGQTLVSVKHLVDSGSRTVVWVALRVKDHSLSRAIKLELDTFILIPFLGNMQRDLEPMVRPAWAKQFPFLSGPVRLPLGFFEGRLRSPRCRPNLKGDVRGVIKSVSIEQRAQIGSPVVTALAIRC